MTIESLQQQLEQLTKCAEMAEQFDADWHRWARELLTDFKIPFDNHMAGLRFAIALKMSEQLIELQQLRVRVKELEGRIPCEDYVAPHLICIKHKGHIGAHESREGMTWGFVPPKQESKQ